MFYVVLKRCSTVKYVILRKEIALNSLHKSYTDITPRLLA